MKYLVFLMLALTACSHASKNMDSQESLLSRIPASNLVDTKRVHKAEILQGSSLSFQGKAITGIKSLGNNPNGQIDIFYNGKAVGFIYFNDANGVEPTKAWLEQAVANQLVYLEYDDPSRFGQSVRRLVVVGSN